MDSRKCQTTTVSPAKPGDFPLLVNIFNTLARRQARAQGVTTLPPLHHHPFCLPKNQTFLTFIP